MSARSTLAAVRATEDVASLTTRVRTISARTAFESEAELAEWLGVDRSQLTRYKRGQQPRGEAAWRLLGLDAVVAALRQVLEAEVIPDWLQGINAHLNHQRPLDVLRAGRLADVIAAVEAERAGSYA
ncbi:MAG TPA: hypothetical protein VFS40_10315 [Gemmatimonadales bacterium]|nr:hypothetical protein [Gemmatimonadales bacterium]